jgi:predicted  nucleic acid-binding Zn-ribbon protein
LALLDFAMDSWLRAVRSASEAAKLEAQGMAKKNGERISQLRRESETAKDRFVQLVRELQRGETVGSSAGALAVGGAA